MSLHCAHSNENDCVHFVFITLDSYHAQHHPATIGLVLNFLHDTNGKYPPFLGSDLIFVNLISLQIFTVHRTTVIFLRQ